MPLAFGDHVLDPLRRELRRGAEPVALEPQVFDLLFYLIANRDRVVTKDDLIDSVWGGRIVSDSALTTRIAAARRAIGDTGEAQTPIRTVARRGFRSVGAVREDRPEAPPQSVPGAEAREELAAAALALDGLAAAWHHSARELVAAEARYAGLWLNVHASVRGRGRLSGYACRIARSANAPTLVIEPGDGGRYTARGPLLTFGDKLYAVFEVTTRPAAMACFILSGVTDAPAAILDGILATRDGGPETAPAASRVMLIRLSADTTDAALQAARNWAGARTDSCWEPALPKPLLAAFIAPPPSEPPAPSLLRVPTALNWATYEGDLSDENIASMPARRAAVDTVRALFALTWRPTAEPAN